MTPREKAEACYRLARSTEHAGERDAAIGRGDAICDKHGLDKATFEVPGRAKPKVEARFERANFSYARTHEYGARSRSQTADDLFAEVARHMGEGDAWAEAMRSFARAASLDPAEVERSRQAQAARFREQTEPLKRKAEQSQQAAALDAADKLSKRGFVVTALGGTVTSRLGWYVTYQGRTEHATHAQLLALWKRVADREVERAEAKVRAENLKRWAAEGVHFTFDEGEE